MKVPDEESKFRSQIQKSKVRIRGSRFCIRFHTKISRIRNTEFNTVSCFWIQISNITYRNPKACLTLTLSTLCAAGEATHLGAAGQHNLQAARGNRGEYTKPNLSEYYLIILLTIFRRLIIALSKCNDQCCGSGMFTPDPGSEFFHPGSQTLLGPNGTHFARCDLRAKECPGSRVKRSRIRLRIKKMKYFYPKRLLEK